MHQVQIPMEGDDKSWRQRCYNRIGILKAKEFPGCESPPSHQEELFGEKNSVIFELQKAVQNGSVDKFVEVLERVCSEKKLLLSDVVHQVTRSGDSLLHEAAYFGRTNIAELIIHHFPELLTKTNVKGDTPLHVASRAKSLDVIKFILSQYDAHKSKSSTENHEERILITRMTNEYRNTALHEAVYSNHLEGVTLLFHADQSVAHETNKSSKSPLYLAVLSSNKEIINVLLEASFPSNKPYPRCHGNSPLHASIYTKNADLLKEILDRRSNLMYLRDEYGGTPLHYAATKGYVEGVRMLLKESTLTALEWNTKGHLPIHLACKWGHVEVLKEFLKQESADFRALINKKGQNILHVAANNGQISVVKYLLRKRELVQLFLNERDRSGNTPLHLAAKHYFPQVLFYLTQEKSIDLNITNNEGFTARDIALVRNEIPWTRKEVLSNVILYTAGAKINDKARSVFLKRRVPAKVEWIKDRVNTLMLVAILIVTVTFAAGFTVPGSVYSDDSNPHKRGIAVLSNRTMFKVFVVMDTVAMYSSISGSFILLWAQVGDINLAVLSYVLAIHMVGLALLTMNVAFMAAVSLVVSNVAGLACFIIIMGIVSSCFFLSVGILEFSVVESWMLVQPVFRYIVLGILILPYAGPLVIKVKKLQNSESQQARAAQEGR